MTLLRALLLIVICLPQPAWSLQRYTVQVLEQKPQPRENFVQGLQIQDGQLYVSTGNYGQSHLLRYHFADGQLEAKRKLHQRVFAEGLTVFGDKVYQLTWRNQSLLVYRKSDLHLLQRFDIPGEGWGLTNNGVELIYSDGSARLHFMSPKTGKVRRSITVTQQGRPVKYLNELEWIDGTVWANIWQSDRIVIINPADGKVTGSIDLTGLLPANEYQPGTDVLNGIARNPQDGGIWVTGKRWPWLYRIELVPENNAPKSQQSGDDSR